MAYLRRYTALLALCVAPVMAAAWAILTYAPVAAAVLILLAIPALLVPQILVVRFHFRQGRAPFGALEALKLTALCTLAAVVIFGLATALSLSMAPVPDAALETLSDLTGRRLGDGLAVLGILLALLIAALEVVYANSRWFDPNTPPDPNELS